MVWFLRGACQPELVTRKYSCWRRYQNNLMTVRLNPVFRSRQSGLVLPSLISLYFDLLFFLLCLSWVGWETSTFVCLFLLHLTDSTMTIEVMTWVLHLGNHFHIRQKQAEMIAFDNRQSKLHHPPRVLLYAVLWRNRTTVWLCVCACVWEEMEGVSVWVDRWVRGLEKAS